MTKNNAQDEQLVVYGADWCPDVRRTRAVLDRADASYRYVDIEQDAQALAIVRRLQRGERRIPTLVWGDSSHLVEPSDDELRAQLTVQR
jgi:glutaredoxin